MTHLLAPLERLLDPAAQFPASASSASSSASSSSSSSSFVSIGVGDGGNEVGMGKVRGRVLGSSVPQAAKVSCVVAADHLLVCGVSNWGGTAIAAALMLLAHDDENRVLQERQERLPVGQAAEAEAEGGERGGGGGGGGGSSAAAEQAASGSEANPNSSVVGVCESSGAVSSMDLREQDAPMRARDCYQTKLAYPLRRAWAEGLPSDADDVAVLEAMVAAGCRDGCSQRNEATVDGLPFEDSLQINRALKEIFLREPE